MPSQLRITIVSPAPADLDGLVRALGMTAVCVPAIPPYAEPSPQLPDVVIVDLRNQQSVPPAIADLTRRHPGIGVVIVASSLDPSMMLETLHAGAKNFLAAPLTPEQLDEALKRVVGERPATEGQVLAFVGAKGGTGTTTLAVNVATALARLSKGEALLVDLHTRYGDVTACLGLEPRFTVADALDNAHRLDEPFMRGLVARSAADLDVLAASERGLPGASDLARLRSLLKFATQKPASFWCSARS
jgi:pilus assembly protein CpaE